MKKTALAFFTIMYLVSTVFLIGLSSNIHPVEASGTIYIRVTGEVEGTDKIQRDGDIYTFADNIYDEIVVERSNITIDGNGYTLQGGGDGSGFLVYRIDNVTIRNTNIDDFSSGVKLYESFSDIVSGNNVTNNYYGISLPWSSNNDISGNRIGGSTYSGIELWASSGNMIFGNIITDNGDGVTLSSSSNNNTISGNVISSNWDKGVYIGGSSHNRVNGNNEITDNDYGIQLSESSHTTISINNLTSNDKAIDLEDSSDNTIYGNNIKNARYGILSDTSDNNILSQNILCNNRSYGGEESYGIWLGDSSNDTLSGNLLNGHSYSFYVTGYSVIHHMHSIDVSNLIDGKPVHYLVNQKGLSITPSTYPEIGYMAVINSTNIGVKGLDLRTNGQGLLLAYTNNSTVTCNNITNNVYGVYLRGCSNNTVSGNNITNNIYGIYLRKHPLSSDKSSNNTVTQNSITNNAGYGVEISASSYNHISSNKISNNCNGIYLFASGENTISGNNIVSNTARGIDLEGSSNNIICGNNVVSNGKCGIDLSEIYFFGASSNNSIFHNSFLYNNEQVCIYQSANFWDDGAEGNCWSNYTGVDLDCDGIGDFSHNIDPSNADRYPLMGMFSAFNATSEHHVQIICNSTVSDFDFDGTALSFTVTGDDGTVGFCRTCIPTALLNETYTVLVNGVEVSHTLLPCSNSMYSYIYFTYTHSTQEVTIIPEFPSILIVPLLMVLTLGVAVLSKKKRLCLKSC